jgi:hypothetical protein
MQPYFYRHQRGRYANRLEVLAKRARARKFGLWRVCPRTPYNPTRGSQRGDRFDVSMSRGGGTRGRCVGHDAQRSLSANNDLATRPLSRMDRPRTSFVQEAERRNLIELSARTKPVALRDEPFKRDA